SSRNPALSPEVDAVLNKGLAKDPAARWGSATELVEALAEALSRQPSKVLAETVVMASPIITTRAIGRTAVAAPPAGFVEEETTLAYPSPPPPAAIARRSNRRRRPPAAAAG